MFVPFSRLDLLTMTGSQLWNAATALANERERLAQAGDFARRDELDPYALAILHEASQRKLWLASLPAPKVKP